MPDDDWQKNLERLKRVTEEHPNDGLAWLALGDFFYDESENLHFAIRAYERAQELLPQIDLRLRLGRAYIGIGERDRGIGLLKASAAERPRTEAYCFLADAYLCGDEDADAEDAALRAIQLEPTFEEGYYLLGEALRNRDNDAAIQAYRTAISLDKDYALAWQALGRELVGRDVVEEGVSALSNAVRLDPDDVWSRAFLAAALWKAGKVREADEQYRAAIDLAPEFEELRRWYADFRDSNA